MTSSSLDQEGPRKRTIPRTESEVLSETVHGLENALGEQFDASEHGTERERRQYVRQKLRDITEAEKSKTRYHKGEPRLKFLDVRHTAAPALLELEAAHQSEFWGFYTPFWLAVAILTISVAVKTVRHHGLLGAIQQLRVVEILVADIVGVALSDLGLYLGLYVSFGLQYLCKKLVILWRWSGFLVQSIYEIGYFVGVMMYLEFVSYGWIAKVFLVLHSLVMLMKMHSYAFYNGYFWSLSEELEFSEKCLSEEKELSAPEQKALRKSVDFCKLEMAHSAQDEKNRFPANITLVNFFWYTMFPTVVYEIEYPRTATINWNYICRKVLGVFGIIGVMIAVAQEIVYPLAVRALELRELTFADKLMEYPFLLLDMLPPFFLLYILVFFLIWDQILPALAELTRFADRDFYGPWWNCVTWDEFLRWWNSPVHRFLLRHVYHSLISALNLSKLLATLMTFVLSSLFHEAVMYVLFGRLRCYLFAIQMYQLPLIAVSRSRFMRNQALLGNIIFWIGIASGAALVCSLYLVF